MTARHNAAGRLIYKALLQGELGADIVSADVGAMIEDNHSTQGRPPRALPTWLVHLTPGMPTSRPDIVIVTSTQRKPHNGRGLRTHKETSPKSRYVKLIEIKYCQDHQYLRTLERAHDQHKLLVEHLSTTSRSCQLIPILLGVGGSIYTQETLQQLSELGLTHNQCTCLCQQLVRNAASWAKVLTSTRRQLEVQGRGG